MGVVIEGFSQMVLWNLGLEKRVGTYQAVKDGESS
jgi:hypothetical protein